MSTPALHTRRSAIRQRRLVLHPLWLFLSARLWKSLAFLLLNLPAGLLYFLVLFTLLSVGIGTLPLGIGFVLLALVPPLTLIGAHIERQRANWFLDGAIPSPAGAHALPLKELLAQIRAPGARLLALSTIRALFRRSWALAHEQDTWRCLAYLLLLYPIGTIEAFGFKLQLDVFSTNVVQPALAVMRGGGGMEASPWALLGLPTLGWLVVLVTVFVGLLWLVAEAYLIVALAHLHRMLAVSLLGPSPMDERARLEARVQALDQSRTRLLDAVLLERQRLERDLHDGAQQRLVALALDLGMAREKLATQPDTARELVTHAHEEAKRALAELRDLVRGIHPAVLTDRGLDPALSALAARCPVPITVTIELPERPAEAVEATAYFVAAEALANIAKHSGATEACIEVRRARNDGGDELCMRVTDNGHGGADATRGTGLLGIADRVAALDGRLSITSPAGGPTDLVVELPWQPRNAGGI